MNCIISANVKILVIGDLMLDHYIHGSCDRISPEAPVPVVIVNREVKTLGGAGNVIENLRALGCMASLIAVVGDDLNGRLVKQHVTAAGVSPHGIIRDRSRCTTVKSRVIVSTHQLIRLDQENVQQISDVISKIILDILKEEILNVDLVCLSDYKKGMLPGNLLKEIFSICSDANVRTIVDPKGDDFSKYRGATIIKPNKKEAIAASGIMIKDKETLQEACVKIAQITGCEQLVITMSEDGMAVFSDNKLTEIPTRGIDIVDVTGAGDTVLAAIGIALASGNSLHNACDFANHAAAKVISKLGSSTVTLDEIGFEPELPFLRSEVN